MKKLIHTRPLTQKDIKEKEILTKWHHYFRPDLPVTESCMAFGLEIGEGWLPLITELCEFIDKEISKEKLQSNYGQWHFMQVKEKFGTLRIYTSWCIDEIDKKIDELECRSATICEQCGKKGKIRRDRVWILTLCNKCNKKDRKDRGKLGFFELMFGKLIGRGHSAA